MEQLNKKRIFLIGMMGVGKSSIGLGVAKWTGIDYYDLDETIRKNEKMSVSEIFKKKGENYFRSQEFALLKKLTEEIQNDILISTGGGTPLFHNSMNYMNSNGDTVWLYVPIEIIIERLRHAIDDRPLLAMTKQNDFEKQVREIYKVREPIYSQSKYKIDASGYDDDVIAKIIHIIGQQ